MAAIARRARIAVVGAGWWSQGWHLPQLHRNPHASVAAIVDPSPELRSTLADLEQLDALGRRYGAPTFPTVGELLASDNTALDGVLVASTHATHSEIATQALDRGLHVLCEKPMTTDPGEAWALAAAAERSGKYFCVNNTANWRANC